MDLVQSSLALAAGLARANRKINAHDIARTVSAALSEALQAREMYAQQKEHAHVIARVQTLLAPYGVDVDAVHTNGCLGVQLTLPPRAKIRSPFPLF